MGKLKDMKKKFEEHCGEYRLSNQDGLFIDWQMDFFDKYYIPISEIKEGSYEDGYLDGFEKGKGVVMGTTDCIPIDEIKILIAKEITVANSEGQPTSRLTSLYNKLSINKTNKEEEWVWCTECGKEKVYDGTICNSCKEWLVK